MILYGSLLFVYPFFFLITHQLYMRSLFVDINYDTFFTSLSINITRMNHYVLFGGGYLSQARSMIQQIIRM